MTPMAVVFFALASLVTLAGWIFLSRKYKAIEYARKNLDADVNKLREDSAKIYQSISEYKEKTQKMKNALLCIDSQYDYLVKRYMINRITLLSLTKSDFTGSTELLYKMDDLRIKKESKEINSTEYMMEVDKIFFELENK